MNYIFILITIVLFSTIEVSTKFIGASIDSLFLAFLRFFLSGLIFVIPEYKRVYRLKLKDFGKFALMGILGVGIAIGSFHYGLNYMNASTAAVIFSINPIFSAFFASFFMKEKITAKVIIGCLLAVAGSYIITFGYENFQLNKFFDIQYRNIKGPVLLWISSIAFGCYIAASKGIVREYGNRFSTGMIFLLGSLTYIPLIKSYRVEVSFSTVLILAHLIIGATAIAYLLYFKGLQEVSVAVGSSMFYLKPIFASILSVFVLHEELKRNFFVGIIIVFAGLFFVTLDKISIKKLQLKSARSK